jgi:hypothetical protein
MNCLRQSCVCSAFILALTREAKSAGLKKTDPAVCLPPGDGKQADPRALERAIDELLDGLHGMMRVALDSLLAISAVNKPAGCGVHHSLFCGGWDGMEGGWDGPDWVMLLSTRCWMSGAIPLAFIFWVSNSLTLACISWRSGRRFWLLK